MPMMLFVSSCGMPWNLYDLATEDDSGTTASSAIEPTKTYAVALGGVARGRDELVIYDDDNKPLDFTGKTLEFSADNGNIVLEPRSGYGNFAAGGGALIVPKKVGTTIVSYDVDGVRQHEHYKVIVPPQSLIQILIGEARGQIAVEAQTADGFVKLDSESTTGNAIGVVVRNRVQLIEAGQPAELFVVDDAAWAVNEPQSHWDAVIAAESNGSYQFTPLDPAAQSYDEYMAAEKRANLLNDSEINAYDQAVLTAAMIFDNSTVDPTGGAFGFRTPTSAEAACLSNAMQSPTYSIPVGCGPGDSNFPAFAPVQILVHPSVALLSDRRPSFVFYRNRGDDEVAVTNAP